MEINKAEQRELALNELVVLTNMARAWMNADINGSEPHKTVNPEGKEITIPGRSPADCDGTEDFILTDYIEKLSKWMMPYVRRLLELEYITMEEYDEFGRKLAGFVDEMFDRLQLSREGEEAP